MGDILPLKSDIPGQVQELILNNHLILNLLDLLLLVVIVIPNCLLLALLYAVAIGIRFYFIRWGDL